MATRIKPVDVVIVGFGWTGGIIAKELAGTGLSILALERGGPRDTNPDFMEPNKDDELRYAVRHELMQDVTKETITFRNKAAQTALPMRQLGSFLLGEGVGGAGVHWNGMNWRWSEWDHQARSRTTAQYGAKFIPDDMLLADFGVSYAELEPYYDRFEKLTATSGRAGNLRGEKRAGGNVFEGPRGAEYPLPPLKSSQSMVMFERATREMGYHPFTGPAANASEAYQNPDGVQFGACHYCGFCERFGCEANAKASPHFTVAPIALSHPIVELRTRARVMKVNLTPDGKRATGVNYVDSRGREFEQPANLVFLSAYGLGNVHLMLLSGIGTPYDPASGKGTIGRAYAYQSSAAANGIFDAGVTTNPFMGAGALAMCMDDYNGGNFDFAKAGFIAGGMLFTSNSGARPIQYHPVPPGTPRWGSAWKKAAAETYNHSITVANMGSVMSYRQNYLDLDPTYRDAYGRPMLRMTFDFQPNEIRQMNHQADRAMEIIKAMGAQQTQRILPPLPYSIVPYQSTHNTGGSVMGTDPATSAVNRYGQSWDVPNVFVTGASLLPQNAGKNPTGPVGALAMWIADAVKSKYLKNPGPI